MKHVVIEGLPAAGKSEILELLARFYPHRVRVLPEMVKQLVETEGIDLFNERTRLTDALRAALPDRLRQIRALLDQGYVCLEESHLGVHLAYSSALGDTEFQTVYPSLAESLPLPDAYVRLDLPIASSLQRQHARGTEAFDIDGKTLADMLAALDRWHEKQPVPRVHINADRPPHDVVAEIVDLLQLSYGAEGGMPPVPETFDTLLLLGRPASGKSEFIDFMTRIAPDVRSRRYFLSPLRVLDDFPLLWELFQQDDVWETVGRGRLFSRRSGENYAVADDFVWSYLIERLNQRARSLLRERARLARRETLLIEFSRGGPCSYRNALHHLSAHLLRRAAALYVSVSFEESWRRNVARYDKKKRDGILTHSVPREEMERSYGADDWRELTDDAPSGVLQIHGLNIPFVTMNNEPESKDPAVLGRRYSAALASLHTRWLVRQEET
jgi:thymidylate kinase